MHGNLAQIKGVGAGPFDFSGMTHTCLICGDTFAGSNKIFIPEIGDFIESNICFNCWIGCSSTCLATQIHRINRKRANFQQIWKRVELFKAALESHIRN